MLVCCERKTLDDKLWLKPTSEEAGYLFTRHTTHKHKNSCTGAWLPLDRKEKEKG